MDGLAWLTGTDESSSGTPSESPSETQALRLAECTVLPLDQTRWLVQRATARYGELDDAQFDAVIRAASASWPLSASARIVSDAWTLLLIAMG